MQAFNTRKWRFVRTCLAFLLCLLLIAGLGGLTPQHATASPGIVITDYGGTADASYLVFKEIAQFDSSSFDPPSTVATAAVQFGSDPDLTGSAASFQSALGINAVETRAFIGGGSQARFSANTSFFVQVRNADPRADIPITFKFVINDGEVRVENFAGLQDPLQFIGAHVFARIHIIGISGGSVWEFPLRLTQDQNGNPVLLNNIIGRSVGIVDDFGVGTPNVRGPFFEGAAAYATIERFEAEFPLGVLRPGDSFQVLYDMEAQVDYEGSPPLGGLAAIGDPFGLSSGGGGEDIGAQLYLNGMDLGQFPFGEPSPTLSVAIDVKPGSDRNRINPESKGVIPVAILTTAVSDGEAQDFDATTVDPLSVAFGPNGVAETHEKGHIQDVDDDGDNDLVLHFRTRETGIGCGDTQVVLTGETFAGESFEGVDVVNVVGC